MRCWSAECFAARVSVFSEKVEKFVKPPHTPTFRKSMRVGDTSFLTEIILNRNPYMVFIR